MVMTKSNFDQLSKQILLKGFVPDILIIFGIEVLQYDLYASNELQNNQKNLTVIAQNLSNKIEGSIQFAVGLAVLQTAYYELFASPVLNRNTQWFDKAIDPFEKKEYFYTSPNVKTGNWLVIVRKSKDQVTGAIWKTTAVLLVLSLIGLVISGCLIYRVLIRTSNRIEIALNAANELAKSTNFVEITSEKLTMQADIGLYKAKKADGNKVDSGLLV
jgi:sensor histidine kinase YesM